MIQILFLILFLLTVPSSQAADLPSEIDSLKVLRSDLDTSGGILFSSGASNTGGFGLLFGIRDRSLHHLVTNQPDAIRAMQSKKVCMGLVLDRFFPTAFPMLANTAATEAELKELVTSIMKPILKTGCTIVVADLFDPSSVTLEQASIIDQTLPLMRLKQAMQMADPSGKNTRAVNETLKEIAKKEGAKVVLIPYNATVIQLADSKTPGSVVMKDLFQNDGDDVHINYSGQAFFFNLFIREALSKVSGVKIGEMKTQAIYSGKWEAEVLRAAASLSPNETGEAKLINQAALTADTHQITGKKEGVMTKKGDLALVDKAVRSALATPMASFHIERRRKPTGEKVYELDLTKQAYTKIELKQSETDPSVYIGMGSDYWGASIGASRYFSPALTNYVFVLTEIDETHLNVEWKILPQLVVGKKTQKIPSERKATVVDPDKIWVPELEKNLKDYTRLEYLIETEVEWHRK